MLFLSSFLSLFPSLYSCFFRLKLSSCLNFHLVIFLYCMGIDECMSVLHAWTSVYHTHAWCLKEMVLLLVGDHGNRT